MTAFLRQPLQQVGKSQAQAQGPLLGLPSTNPCQTTSEEAREETLGSLSGGVAFLWS